LYDHSMLTRILPATAKNIRRAADVLRAGGLVAFPTETVYGLGARALSAENALQIYKAKGRPSDNPLIVHVDGVKMLSLIVRRISPLARRLMSAYWPGPVTLVFNKSELISDVITGKQGTIAVRCPQHPVARALITAFGEPIAAPSANRSGRPSPTTAAHVKHDLDRRIPLILDGAAIGSPKAVISARATGC
jgi:L-threonylcarbamoyladenylate synthase